jgi:hypothetical protein
MPAGNAKYADRPEGSAYPTRGLSLSHGGVAGGYRSYYGFVNIPKKIFPKTIIFCEFVQHFMHDIVKFQNCNSTSYSSAGGGGFHRPEEAGREGPCPQGARRGI